MYYGTKVHIDDTVFYLTETKKQMYGSVYFSYTAKNRKFTSFYSYIFTNRWQVQFI